MSIIRVREAVSASMMVLALGSVMVFRTFTNSVNSMVHISSMLYPATLQDSHDLALWDIQRYVFQIVLPKPTDDNAVV